MASSIYQQGKDLFYQQTGANTLTKIANPTELQTLAKAGAIEVGKEYKPFASFQPNVSVPSVIPAPDTTKPQVSLPTTPTIPDYKSFIKNVPTIDVNSFKSSVDTGIAEAQDTNKTLGTRILDMVNRIGGKQQALTTAQQNAGVFDYQKQLTDINSQIQQLQKENSITKLNAQGQPIAQDEINKQTADADRRYAVKALGLSSIAQTLQGNLSLASDLAQRAVDTEYGAYENQLNYLKTALDLNKETMSSAEKKRAEELNLYIENQKMAIDAAKEEKKNIYDILSKAAQGGADSLTLNKILESGTAADALSLASKFIQDTSNKVIGTESTGYYERQADGTYKQVVPAAVGSGASAATPSQILNRAGVIKQSALAEGRIISDSEAISQAQREFAMLGGGGSFVGSQAGPEATNVDYGNLVIPATKLMKDMSEEELSAIQAAMQKREGYFPGSIAYRTNNPGNIKFGNFAKSMGAVDSGIKGADGGTFASFPNYDAGRAAQMALLRAGSYANLTFDAAMKRWSNNGYGANVIGNKTASVQQQDTSQAWQTGIDLIDSYTKKVYTGEMPISEVPKDYQTVVQKQVSTLPKIGNANFQKMNQSERALVEEVLNLQTMINRIKETRQSATDTGPIASAWGSAMRLINKENPDFAALRVTTENLRAQIQKLISGAALSEAEVKRLLKFIPVVSDNDKNFDTKLAGLENQYNDIMTNKAKMYGFSDQNSFKKALFGQIEMPGSSSGSAFNQNDARSKYNY